MPDRAHPLDNPVRNALHGPHAHLAEHFGVIARYPEDAAPFIALPDEPSARMWRDLAAMAGPGNPVMLAMVSIDVPDDWELEMDFPGVQMTGPETAGPETAGPVAPDDDILVLGPDDVPEMLALVALARPGPFRSRTIELGTYRGIRRDGALVAMAGERLRVPGWTEISAVCTAPEWRGHGFASRLIRAVEAGIRARGDAPFLHASASNESAIRLYESLGYRVRRTTSFKRAKVPVTGWV